MKTRYILSFAVFGILLVALFALSSCNGDDGVDDTQFGGPYAFGWRFDTDKRMMFGEEKRKDFECYNELSLSLSKAVKLDEPLFKRSIEANKELSNGVGTQKHNFVIAKVGENIEIIVAKWKEDNPELDKDKKVSEQCQCRIDDNLGLGAANTMVNLFPEDKEADPRKSPCWLDSAKSKGLLDAISKHLMLAQGEGKTIGNFDVQKWATEKEDDWMQAMVRYAGEFTVDVGNTCISDVNGNSGTYQPETSDQILKKVWEHFGNTFKLCN